MSNPVKLMLYQEDVQGIYMVHDETRRPDVIVYYCHGTLESYYPSVPRISW